MNTFKTMLKIEGKLSVRNMNMIIFALIMPLIIFFVFGFIYGDKTPFEGASYTFIDASFGALSTISICASGLMGLPILVSDYRERRILKRLKVTPVSSLMLIAVELCMYSAYCLISLLLLWMTGSLLFGLKIHGSVLLFFTAWCLVLFSILSIGMFVGILAKNAKTASVITCFLYFPMLIFSGATIPYEIMPEIVRNVVDFMPITVGIKILKAASTGSRIDNMFILVISMVCIGVIFTILSVKYFKWD